MLRNLLFLMVGFCFVSCGNTNHEASVVKESKTENALKFINDYVTNCNQMGKATEITEWVNSSVLATASFKSALDQTITEAWKADPELGLGFDPIFDAQDYPDEGFELESMDEKTNYLIVKGKNWAQFKLKMKVRKENGKWLVDGCGIINIPAGERIKR